QLLCLHSSDSRPLKIRLPAITRGESQKNRIVAQEILYNIKSKMERLLMYSPTVIAFFLTLTGSLVFGVVLLVGYHKNVEGLIPFKDALAFTYIPVANHTDLSSDKYQQI